MLILLTVVSFKFTEWHSILPVVACGASLTTVLVLAIVECSLRRLRPKACILGGLAISIAVTAVAALIVFEALSHLPLVAEFRPPPRSMRYTDTGNSVAQCHGGGERLRGCRRGRRGWRPGGCCAD